MTWFARRSSTQTITDALDVVPGSRHTGDSVIEHEKPARRRATRFVAIAACVALCSQLFALAHLWLVPHTQCAEHGETIHGESHGEPVVADPQEPRLAFEAARSQGSNDDGHDHCQLLTDRRPWANDRIETAPVLVAAGGGEYHVASRIVVVRALYRTAPKASPPSLHA